MIPVTPVRFELPEFDCKGALLEANGSHVQVQFGQETGLALALGSHHAVRAVLEESGRVLKAEATTIFRQEDTGGARRYGFELDLDLEQELRPRASRRDAYRVTSDRRHPIALEVRVPGGLQGSHGRVDNLSIVGLLARLPADADQRLTDHDTVELRFQLPDSESTLLLQGAIRYRRLSGGEIQLGIEYLTNGLPKLAEQELTQYIMRRQLKQLRRRSSA